MLFNLCVFPFDSIYDLVYSKFRLAVLQVEIIVMDSIVITAKVNIVSRIASKREAVAMQSANMHFMPCLNKRLDFLGESAITDHNRQISVHLVNLFNHATPEIVISKNWLHYILANPDHELSR